jgi:hypothetical protein
MREIVNSVMAAIAIYVRSPRGRYSTSIEASDDLSGEQPRTCHNTHAVHSNRRIAQLCLEDSGPRSLD